MLWSEDNTECSDPHPLTDFIKFLDQCLQAVEIVTETRLPDSTLAHKKSRQQVSRSAFHNDHSQDTARALHTRNAEGCPYCNGHHSLYFCQAFKNLNVDKRNNVLNRNNFYYNCLSRVVIHWKSALAPILVVSVERSITLFSTDLVLELDVLLMWQPQLLLLRL